MLLKYVFVLLFSGRNKITAHCMLELALSALRATYRKCGNLIGQCACDWDFGRNLQPCKAFFQVEHLTLQDDSRSGFLVLNSQHARLHSPE